MLPAALLPLLLAGSVDLAALEGWEIVVPPDAIASERFAAEELREHLERATGWRLPIEAAPHPAARGRFQLGSGAGDAALGEEELRIEVGEGRVEIGGGRPRGTLYGVYTFLEDYLGVRFLSPDHTHVPRLRGPRPVGPLRRRYRPPLTMRWPASGEVAADPLFAARLRVNAVSDDPRLGGRTPEGLITHSFLHLLPSRRWGREHPEWYALREGRRLAGPFESDATATQPCLTNPQVRARITAEALRALELHPQLRSLSISQNDNDQHCQCDACRALDEREGSPMGSLLTLVNAVADEVARRRPDVKVGTLAYWYSRRPPRQLRPRPNVQIQLCSIECCQLHAIDDPACPLNVEFCRDLAAWGERCQDLRVWSYATDFSDYLLPCPNLATLGPNLRWFAARGARGVFLQAAHDARGAELSELRTWLAAQLLWDPARDASALRREFLALHYGPAAPPIEAWLEQVQARAQECGVHQGCFARRAAEYGLDAELGRAGVAAFDEAARRAPDEVVRARVERASLGALRLALEPVWGGEPAPQALAEELRPLALRLFQAAARQGVTHAAERSPLELARQRVLGGLGPW